MQDEVPCTQHLVASYSRGIILGPWCPCSLMVPSPQSLHLVCCEAHSTHHIIYSITNSENLAIFIILDNK